MEITSKEDLEFYDQNNIFNDIIQLDFEIDAKDFDNWLNLPEQLKERIRYFRYCASSGRIYNIYKKRNDNSN